MVRPPTSEAVATLTCPLRSGRWTIGGGFVAWLGRPAPPTALLERLDGSLPTPWQRCCARPVRPCQGHDLGVRGRILLGPGTPPAVRSGRSRRTLIAVFLNVLGAAALSIHDQCQDDGHHARDDEDPAQDVVGDIRNVQVQREDQYG